MFLLDGTGSVVRNGSLLCSFGCLGLLGFFGIGICLRLSGGSFGATFRIGGRSRFFVCLGCRLPSLLGLLGFLGGAF